MDDAAECFVSTVERWSEGIDANLHYTVSPLPIRIPTNLVYAAWKRQRSPSLKCFSGETNDVLRIIANDFVIEIWVLQSLHLNFCVCTACCLKYIFLIRMVCVVFCCCFQSLQCFAKLSYGEWCENLTNSVLAQRKLFSFLMYKHLREWSRMLVLRITSKGWKDILFTGYPEIMFSQTLTNGKC